jgi:Beta-galactosidase trimerisation domain
LDLANVSPAPAEIAIIIPDEWAKPHGDFSRFGLTGPEVTPYISQMDGDAMPGQAPPDTSAANEWLMGSALNTFVLAHRAGLKADFPREYNDWSKYPMLFLPSPLTSTTSNIVHVHTDFYEKAKKYVEGGGFLYASVAADAGIPDMEKIFGARLVDTVTVSEVTLKIVEPFGGLKPGDTFHYSVPGANPRVWGSLLEVMGGKVIAVDQDGRPALVANTVGSGKTLLSAYPIETYLANTPSAFEKPESTHRIYEAFRNWTGVKAAFQSDQPSVEVTSLRGNNRGYAVVVNHSAQAYKVTISTSLPVKSVRQIGADSSQSLPVEGSAWKMELEPYEAAIVEWK